MNNQSIKLLSDFIAIESVSTDKSRYREILKAVDFLKKMISKLGFEVDIYQIKDSSPLIVAKRIISPNLKTIGIYAHYDVQPEDPVDKWDSPPFKLDIRGGKIYGRGVADDKGHIIQILTAIDRSIKNKKLSNNIVLVFEGEEENKGANFELFVGQAKKDLETVDVFYIFDMGMKAKNIPQIFYGLRGIITGELKIKIGKTDLHSGIYGNRVMNPAQIIAELLAKIKNGETNEIKIPEFYSTVKKISQKERDLLSEFISDDETEKKNAGIKKFIGDFLSSKVLPSFEVNGIVSGYTGQGAKTIIPSEATLKFSIRLVPNQISQEIKKITEDFIRRNLPKGVDYVLEISDGGDPFYTDFENHFAKKTAEILSDVFKNKTYFNRSGGSIAAAEVLQRLFKKPIILTGFTLPDENIHAPNENIDEEMFYKGIVSLEKIISQ
ncbi:MAG: M20/M25/M40 family metallo-hydrolase [Candidatus Roizmanbacteria bacterium]|nr:M20/M25/M40 family metallo-hydrolase [Candidatus Roizmanbacteria bacterium]MCR4313526.1 M20/M25/M40 family metallo-hydrolase [Candidatus Roizmanbacteria bacterium]